MNRTLLHAIGALLLSSPALALGQYPYADISLEPPQQDTNKEVEPRLFFLFTNASTGTFVTFNSTLLLFGAGILLWGIAGAIALYYLLTAPTEESGGYGYSSGSGYGGYSSGRSSRGCVNPSPNLSTQTSPSPSPVHPPPALSIVR